MLASLIVAVRFLTIVPVPGRESGGAEALGRAAAWFPVVGLVLGVALVALDRLLAPMFPPLLCAVLVLVLSGWPTSHARAEDDDGQGQDDNGQGEDSCGSAIVGEDDDNQVDDNAQGDEDGCGMMEVEVDDENGDAVDDMDENGNPDDDVEVDVTEMAQSGPHAGTMVTFHTAQNGSFVLKGLPKGKATITAIRSHNGTTTSATRKKRVREARTKRIRLRLRPAQ